MVAWTAFSIDNHWSLSYILNMSKNKEIKLTQEEIAWAIEYAKNTPWLDKTEAIEKLYGKKCDFCDEPCGNDHCPVKQDDNESD